MQRGQSDAVIHYKMYIDGQWVESEGGGRMDAVNPATGRVFATVPEGTREDARRAIAAARQAAETFAKWSPWERSRLCHTIATVMERRRDELARTLAEDQGKPYHTEARYEVDKAIEGFYHAAEQIKWLETSFIPVENPHKRVFTFRQPRGVYAVITPWNYPINIPVEYLAPGIATGNTIVWVPAPSTSVCAVKLMECLEEAGVPPGVVNLVTGQGPVVGDEIVAHPGTDAVGFTGSSETGVAIAARAAGKPLLLEMGGNGPVIILDDADLDLACQVAAAGSFANAGQICSSSERILVHARVYDQVAERLVKAAEKVRLGDPFAEETTMGPLNNEKVAAKVVRHVQDSQERGAQVVFGGKVREDLGSPLFHEPTVIIDVPADSLINREETFGPVAPLIRAKDDEEILRLANGGRYGLTCGVFTRDIKRAFHFAENIKSGIVNINDGSTYWELHIPFGGASGKRSGIGRLGGKYTMMEMTDLKTVTIDLR
ncbi:MAG: aldehyde dehydrogenase family protein [Limnochordales bacterium]|nr:aldehyde dehydrogenase family protein [Limnochordales bacterium]